MRQPGFQPGVGVDPPLGNGDGAEDALAVSHAASLAESLATVAGELQQLRGRVVAASRRALRIQNRMAWPTATGAGPERRHAAVPPTGPVAVASVTLT